MRMSIKRKPSDENKNCNSTREERYFITESNGRPQWISFELHRKTTLQEALLQCRFRALETVPIFITATYQQLMYSVVSEKTRVAYCTTCFQSCGWAQDWVTEALCALNSTAKWHYGFRCYRGQYNRRGNRAQRHRNLLSSWQIWMENMWMWHYFPELMIECREEIATFFLVAKWNL